MTLSIRATALAVSLLFIAVGCSDENSPDASDTRGASSSGSASSSAGSGGSGGGPGACPTTVTPKPGTVVTETGAVTGASAGGTWAYLGIPYAAPPLGDLRWAPPAPAACWEGARDATAWGPVCPQLEKSSGPFSGDEDCLQLNVWVPEPAPTKPAPVLVWIHGGGHQIGSAAEEMAGVRLYDAQALAESTQSVVVTINYRLGALGWLAHPALTAENEHGSSGNYGHLDQIAALEWVQRNIAAFGGDRSRVLAFGESAGAVSVCSLVASPLAKGLFSAAVMQSGGCVAQPLAEAEVFGADLFEAAGCGGEEDPVACMRALPADQVVSALPAPIDVAGKGGSFDAAIDGWALKGVPRDVIAAGEHNAVPMIIGSNSDETSRSVPLPLAATEAQYNAAVQALIPGAAAAVLAEYPASDYPSPWAAYVALTSDAKFICTARSDARAFLKGQANPVYRYFFTHALDAAPALQVYGAWHGVDVLYLFGHLTISGYVPSAAEKTIATEMMGYWARLADGSPDGGSALAWPVYDEADSFLRMDDPIETGQGVRTEQCDFWESLL